MNKTGIHFCFLTLILLMLSCSKWDLAKKTFLSVVIEPVADVQITSTLLKGRLEGLEPGDEVNDHGFVWSFNQMEPSFNDLNKSLGSRKNNGNFAFQLTDLPIKSELFVRAYAEFKQTIIYSEPIQVVLNPSQVKIRMDSIVEQRDGVQFFGSINNVEPGVNISAYGHVWSSETNLPTLENGQSNFLGKLQASNLSFSSEFKLPIPLKTYYVRSFIVSGNQPIYSENTLSFVKGDAWIPFGLESPVGRFDRTFEFGDKVYLTIDHNIFVFNPQDITLEYLASIPGSDLLPTSTPAVFMIESKIYITGGVHQQYPNIIPTRATWIFDIESHEWSQGAPYPADRFDFVGFALNGIGYAGFGSEDIGILNYDIWAYDPVTDKWTESIPFPQTSTRTSASVAIFKFSDRVCLGLSFFEPGVDFWCFRGGNNPWERIADFPVQASSFVSDPTYFTIGNKGFVYIHDTRNNFYEYDMNSDTWSIRADFPGGALVNTLAFSYKTRGYLGYGNDIVTLESNYPNIWQYIPILDAE